MRPSDAGDAAARLFYSAVGVAGYGALVAAYDIGFLGTLAFVVAALVALGLAVRE